jgi:biotin operon repressor
MRLRKRGETIRQFIIDNVETHPQDIASLTSQTFKISRQAVNKHVQQLAKQGAILIHGTRKSRHYVLHPLTEWIHTYQVAESTKEDVVWRNDIRPLIGELPDNVVDIWQYGFTEMFNNALDHSGCETITVSLIKSATISEMSIYDDGEGIFTKITRELGLEDERHAVLELSKGKLTTDPSRHTGEGIFFTSRMFDDFVILSGNTFFRHKHDQIEDWILERHRIEERGTFIQFKLNNNTSRMTKAVFDEFSSGDGYGFTKTVVPVMLAQYGDEKLVSRSQAKRLLAGVEKFKVVILDFEGVEVIGQAFADEVFRVFVKEHPQTEIRAVNASEHVEQMISRAISNGIES